jgi:hypothetical protein
MSETQAFGHQRITPAAAEGMDAAEYDAWVAAFRIAWIGASNPRGVQHSIDEHTATMGADHITVRLMKGHLDYLQGNGLGPDTGDLAAVLAFGKRTGQVSV